MGNEPVGYEAGPKPFDDGLSAQIYLVKRLMEVGVNRDSHSVARDIVHALHDGGYLT